MGRAAPKRTKTELESRIADLRSSISAMECDLDALEEEAEAQAEATHDPMIAAVTDAARRLWPDFDYRATNRFVPEDALIEAIRDLEVMSNVK